MNTTLSIIKADVGSIGGHVAPSQKLVNTIRGHVRSGLDVLFTDSYIATTGDSRDPGP